MSLPRTPLGWAAVLAVALVSTVIAIVTFFAGMERVGPVKASTLSTFEPVVTVILAAVVLREAISFTQMLGGALILMAVIVLVRNPGSKELCEESVSA